MLKEEFISKSINIHSSKYDYSQVTYKNNKTKVKIVCPTHGCFEQIPHNHLSGHGCPICALELKSSNQAKSISDFILQSNQIHDFKYNYDKTDYLNNKTKIIVTCPEHGDFMIIPYHHIMGVGCSKCAGNDLKTNNEFISNSIDVHGHKYDYSMTHYINNKIKVTIICPKHGKFLQIPYHHINGHGCPVCNSSKGEIIIKNYLSVNKIEFTSQKKFNGCKNKYRLPFDFYIEDRGICIEYDGEQHFSPRFGIDSFKNLIENDKIKTKYCEDNNIKLIRISYKDFNNIEKILEEKIMT